MTSRSDADLFARIERSIVLWHLGPPPPAFLTAAVQPFVSGQQETTRMNLKSYVPYTGYDAMLANLSSPPAPRPTRFYTVWREGGAAPTKQHLSYDAASKEAERLSQATPGVRFFVMSATTTKFTPKPIAQKTETVHL